MTLRILVDECVQAPIARALASVGHDLHFVGVDDAGIADPAVVALAERSGRILFSEDYGFGDLVVRRRLQIPGLVLIGCGGIAPLLRPARVLSALREVGGDLLDHLTVIEPLRVRRRRLR